MEEKTIQKTVYIAKDGKEFLDKKECEKYEKEFLDKIKYFSIYYNFDYNEGRGFQSIVHVAVIPSRYDYAEVIAEKYAIDVLNKGVLQIKVVWAMVYRKHIVYITQQKNHSRIMKVLIGVVILHMEHRSLSLKMQ